MYNVTGLLGTTVAQVATPEQAVVAVSKQMSLTPQVMASTQQRVAQLQLGGVAIIDHGGLACSVTYQED